MKPTWDKLMKNWNKGKRFATSVIADVDCTGAGKALCEQVGVKGYPTIKWGDPSNLEEYEGGRDYEDLKKFAREKLKPLCSPTNLDLCDDEKKKEISDLQALPIADLEAKVEEKRKLIKEAEDNFEAELNKLQETYNKLQEEKEEATDKIKNSGLGLMKAVLSAAKATKEEL